LSGEVEVTAARRIQQVTMWGALALLTQSLSGPAQGQSVIPEPSDVWPAQIVSKDPATPQVPTDKVDEPIIINCPECESEPLWGCLSSISFGARAWFSWGNSDSNFRVGAAHVASDLHWRDMVAETGEVNVGALFFDRLVVNAMGGGGTISSGRLSDDEFDITGSQGLISESMSPVADHGLEFYNFDLGWRFCQGPCFFFDGLIGYQYWRERYVALGGTQVYSAPGFDVPPVGAAYPPGPRISEQYTWQGFRIGGQAVVQVSPCLAFKSQVFFMPLTHFENQDIHYDLPLVPTSIERSTGGFGVLGDFRVSYWLCSGLFFEAGYRIWDAEAGKGRLTELFSNGNGANLPLNEATTLRQGFTVGLTYQF
jgi:hypothetical protein